MASPPSSSASTIAQPTQEQPQKHGAFVSNSARSSLNGRQAIEGTNAKDQQVDSNDTTSGAGPQTAPNKDIKFWLIILSLMLSTFLAALDLTAISTALPTIAAALDSQDFSWIANSYSVTACAFIPLAGGLSSIYGRRPILLSALGFFFVGSVLCGAAQNFNMMLAGRALQGVGAGSILTLTEIVLADLIPLAERGTYQGIFGAVWALASAIGPIIGGALASAYWPSLFYINLPLTAFAAFVVGSFMRLKTPPGTRQEKLQKIDFLGNSVFIASITLLVIGLVWGDAPYPWTSAHVLAPLIIGAIGLVAWVVIEIRLEYPTVPFAAMTNWTTVIGFFMTFVHAISSLSVFYYWPAWFQSVQGVGPITSAVHFFPVALVCAPFAMIGGASIGISQRYKPQNVIAWILMTVGPGLLSLCNAFSTVKSWGALPVVYAVGLGILYPATVFPVLAPLPPSLAGPALSFLVFLRSFGNLLGVTIGAVVLSNELKKRAPEQWLATLPGGVSSAYANIPAIKTLDEPLRTQVRVAFADSIRVIWLVMIAFGGVGLITACFMRQYALQTETDEKFGMKEQARVDDPEKSATKAKASGDSTAEQQL